jgi:hypothetical protein
MEKLKDSSFHKKKSQEMLNGKSARAHTHTHTHTRTHYHTVCVYGIYAPALTALLDFSISDYCLSDYIHKSKSLDQMLYLVDGKILEDTQLK